MKTRFLSAATELSTQEWANLTGNLSAQMRDPFCSRAFLAAAEHAMHVDNSPVGADDTPLGWKPHHLCLLDDAGDIAALLPLYLRSHSFGDFSRDWGWPDAWERAGLAYYPKLVSGNPEP